MRTEYVTTDHGVSRDLTRPVEIAPREASGLQDAALITTDLVEAFGQANSKLAAIDCILFPSEPHDPRACRTQRLNTGDQR